MAESMNVTRRHLRLGNRDEWTGWRKITYAPDETVKVITFAKGSTYSLQNVGFFSREDRTFLSVTPVEVGDQFVWSNRTYEVVSREQHKPFGTHLCWEYQCHELPLYRAAPGESSWTKTRGSDARYKIKHWLDTYLRHTQLTRDDDETPAATAVMFTDPPYPLHLEFRGTSQANGLFTVEEPEAHALVDAVSQGAYGYTESVPVHVMSVDSYACTGTVLASKMISELRYVAEEYPTGSVVSLSRQSSRKTSLGSTTLYDYVFTYNYRRDKDS